MKISEMKKNKNNQMIEKHCIRLAHTSKYALTTAFLRICVTSCITSWSAACRNKHFALPERAIVSSPSSGGCRRPWARLTSGVGMRSGSVGARCGRLVSKGCVSAAGSGQNHSYLLSCCSAFSSLQQSSCKFLQSIKSAH